MAVEKYSNNVNKRLPGLKLTQNDIFGSSTEGGEISIYSDKSDTLKLKAIYYGETGKNEYELYLRNKELVFFVEKTSFYKSPIGKRDIDRTALTFFVLNKGKVVKGEKEGAIIAKDLYVQKSIEIYDVYNEIKHNLKEQ